MANEKGGLTVIKKITIGGAGAHGGSWKVAFADFMTAMMCFFLVMWLLNQTEEVKKQIASYFSGPSMLEHQFTSYGAELTLEKLFLDLVNEPLGTLQGMLQPADFSPNILAMGSRKVILQQIASELGNVAGDVDIEADRVEFEIPERFLFEKNAPEPNQYYVTVMAHVKGLTTGLANAQVDIVSSTYAEFFEGDHVRAELVASRRGEVLKKEVESSLKNTTVEVYVKPVVRHPSEVAKTGKREGTIRFILRQKEDPKGEIKQRKIEDLFGKKKSDMSVYDEYVRDMSNNKKATNGGSKRNPNSVRHKRTE